MKLIRSFTSKGVWRHTKSNVVERTVSRVPMRLVAELRSDPVAVRGNHLAEQGSPANSVMLSRCRGDASSDALTAQMDEELEELQKILARWKTMRERRSMSSGAVTKVPTRKVNAEEKTDVDPKHTSLGIETVQEMSHYTDSGAAESALSKINPIFH